MKRSGASNENRMLSESSFTRLPTTHARCTTKKYGRSSRRSLLSRQQFLGRTLPSGVFKFDAIEYACRARRYRLDKLTSHLASRIRLFFSSHASFSSC